MIVIIDFGSQFNQLIARRVRECRVYCQIEPPTVTADQIRTWAPEGIILSGGPSSIYEANSPRVDAGIFDLGIPVLGICYGMHFMVDALGGNVKTSQQAGIRVCRPEGQAANGPVQRRRPGYGHLDEPWRFHRRPAQGFLRHRIHGQYPGGRHGQQRVKNSTAFSFIRKWSIPPREGP
jgi:hypothetical protein